MRLLIAECYALFFKLTRAKLFSYWFCLAYLTLLLFWAINGVSRLLSEWLSFAGIIQYMFRFPFYFVTPVLIMGAIYKIAPKMQQVSKDAKKREGFATIILFSLFVLMLFVYMQFGDRIFD